MNLFDGQFKSRPKINLAGSSSTKSRETLINEAIAERRKREAEKKQNVAATKIQSLYRSYTIRQRLHQEYRLKFKQLFDLKNQTYTDTEIKTLLSYFVLFYNPKIDNDLLQAFSQFIVKSKERLIHILLVQTSNTEYALCRFLAIHLLLLNPNSGKQGISQSVSLRLIDYFTNPGSYVSLGYATNQYEPELTIILKFLINLGKIN